MSDISTSSSTQMASSNVDAVREMMTSYSDFKPQSIKYGMAKVNARGGKSIKINDIKNMPLVLTTPLMLTWGVNKLVDDQSGKVSYSMSLQFPSSDYANDESSLFLEKMKAFEEQVLDDSVKHSKEWFGKKQPREVAEALFNPMLKYPKDKVSGEEDLSRPPTLRFKVPYWEGKFNVEFYDMSGETIFNESNADKMLEKQEFETIIPKASHMIACIRSNGIWYANGKFGVTWVLVQAMVNKPLRIQGGCFLRPRDNDLVELNKINERNEEGTGNDGGGFDNEHGTTVTSTPEERTPEEVEDSDVEEEEEENPKPKKVVKRRVVKSKS